VWVNCWGVRAGAGEFDVVDQVIFSFWINLWLRKRPLKYIGFGGKGYQVRDCLHPHDVVALMLKQIKADKANGRAQIVNVSGGAKNSMSLAQLSDWCAERFGPHAVAGDATPRAFDIPWMVLNSALASKIWDWQPVIRLENVLEEIAGHAENHPEWLDLSAP
jgi:CDP-paratose 2-epimerase